MTNKKGFTLIELAVVITIIAILSAVVFINVTQYLHKGEDAAIKMQLNGIQTEAANFYSSNGSYENMCDVGTNCYEEKINIANLYGGFNSEHQDANSYCFSVILSDGSSEWCIDSTGYYGPDDDCGTNPFTCTGQEIIPPT